MVIKLNGEIVERTETDLPNTYSTQLHKPSRPEMQRPHYKPLFNNQMNTNKGLLFALAAVTTLVFALFVGADIRIKAKDAEIVRLNRELDRQAVLAEANVIEYNKLLTVDPYSNDPEEIIEAVFKQDAATAKKIANCESRMKPTAINKNTNGSTDTGLFQINSVHGIPARYLKNPLLNILVAKQIFDTQGWNPWVCSSKIN